MTESVDYYDQAIAKLQVALAGVSNDDEAKPINNQIKSLQDKRSQAAHKTVAERGQVMEDLAKDLEDFIASIPQGSPVSGLLGEVAAFAGQLRQNAG